MLTALKIAQEVAKRIGIMLPTTIVDSETPDTSLIDYDANLIVSCMNSAVQSLMMLHEFSNHKRRLTYMISDNELVYVSKKTNGYQDATLMYLIEPVVKIEGDGVVIVKIVEDVDTDYPVASDRYLFRQFTPADYLRYQTEDHFVNYAAGYGFGWNKNDSFKSATPREKVYQHKKNTPSESLVGFSRAENLESGFFIATDNTGTRRLIIVNNMIKDDIAAAGEGHSYMLQILYKTNYGVLKSDGLFADRFSRDSDRTLIPDELVILGTLINFKGYFGLDYSLDLASQKAYIDKMKENEENIQLTHLNKKHYYSPNSTGA
jgi:hypothetical protein